MLKIEAWGGLTLVEQIVEGNRNEVWRAERNGDTFAVRQSRRSELSLMWELELIDFLSHCGFLVPEVVPADNGRSHDQGVVVQKWIEGTPPESTADWHRVADELQRLHTVATGLAQRPGCCAAADLVLHRTSVDADLDALPASERSIVEMVLAGVSDIAQSVIHGDPHGPNIRITASGAVGLLDWDESRVDVVWHDLSNLGVQVLDPVDHQRALSLSDAWEAVNAWLIEPEYAASRLSALRRRLS